MTVMRINFLLSNLQMTKYYLSHVIFITIYEVDMTIIPHFPDKETKLQQEN